MFKSVELLDSWELKIKQNITLFLSALGLSGFKIINVNFGYALSMPPLRFSLLRSTYIIFLEKLYLDNFHYKSNSVNLVFIITFIFYLRHPFSEV